MSAAVARTGFDVAFALLLVTACSFDPDYQKTRYVCRLDRCPDGFTCVDEVCVPGDPDASTTDASGEAPDASEIDAGASPSCEDQFGDAPSYTLCDESPSTCSFDVVTDGTCDDLCASYGETCVGAVDSDSGTACDDQGTTTCSSSHSSQICECTRGARAST